MWMMRGMHGSGHKRNSEFQSWLSNRYMFDGISRKSFSLTESITPFVPFPFCQFLMPVRSHSLPRSTEASLINNECCIYPTSLAEHRRIFQFFKANHSSWSNFNVNNEIDFHEWINEKWTLFFGATSSSCSLCFSNSTSPLRHCKSYLD